MVDLSSFETKLQGPYFICSFDIRFEGYTGRWRWTVKYSRVVLYVFWNLAYPNILSMIASLCGFQWDLIPGWTDPWNPSKNVLFDA